MIVPVLAKYTVSIGGDLALGGFIVGLQAITALFARPFSGALADNYNMKYIMVVSSAVTALMVLCYSLTVSIPLLILFRIIHGVAFSISSTTNVVFASLFIPQKRMGEGLGYLGLGYIIAMVISPSVGLAVVDTFGFQGVFITAAILAGLSAGLMALMRYRYEKTGRPLEKQAFHLRDFIAVKLIPVSALGGLFSFCNGTINSFIAMLGDERSITNIGLFFTVNSLTLLLIRPLAGKLNDRKGIFFVMIPAYISYALAMAIFAGADSCGWFWSQPP